GMGTSTDRDVRLLDRAVVEVDLDTLSTWPGNARRGDIELLTQSLSVHGQYRPLLGQKSSNRVMAGNNVLLAMRAMGATRRDVLYLEVDDEQAKPIVLMGNRASDLSDYDWGELAQELLELNDDYHGTGYTTEQVTTLLAELNEMTEDIVEEAVAQAAQHVA